MASLIHAGISTTCTNLGRTDFAILFDPPVNKLIFLLDLAKWMDLSNDVLSNTTFQNLSFKPIYATKFIHGIGQISFCIPHTALTQYRPNKLEPTLCQCATDNLTIY